MYMHECSDECSSNRASVESNFIFVERKKGVHWIPIDSCHSFQFLSSLFVWFVLFFSFSSSIFAWMESIERYGVVSFQYYWCYFWSIDYFEIKMDLTFRISYFRFRFWINGIFFKFFFGFLLEIIMYSLGLHKFHDINGHCAIYDAFASFQLKEKLVFYVPNCM